MAGRGDSQALAESLRCPLLACCVRCQWPERPAALCWTRSQAGRGPGLQRRGKTSLGVKPRSWHVFLAVPRSFPLYLPGPKTAGVRASPGSADISEKRARGPGLRPPAWSFSRCPPNNPGQVGSLACTVRLSVRTAVCSVPGCTCEYTHALTCRGLWPHRRVRARTQGGPQAGLPGVGLARDSPGAPDPEGRGRVPACP